MLVLLSSSLYIYTLLYTEKGWTRSDARRTPGLCLHNMILYGVVKSQSEYDFYVVMR